MLKKQIRAKFAINLDLSKKGKLEKFNLYDGETIIGSDKNQCDILLQGQDIAPIHCAINIFDDDLLISVHQDAKSGVYKRAELNKQKKIKLIQENIYSLKLEEDYWISNFKFNIVQYDAAYEEGDQKIQQKILQQNENNNQQQLQATLLLNDDDEENEENQIQKNQNFQETLQLSDDEDQISNENQKANNNNQQFQETLLLDEDDGDDNDKNIQNKNNKMEIEPTLLVSEDCDNNDQNNDPTLIVDSDEDSQKNKIQQDNNLDPTLIDNSDEDQEQQQLKNNNNKMQIENNNNNNLEPTIVENTDSESDELKKIKNTQNNNNNLEATIIDDEQSDDGNNNDLQNLKKKLNIDQQNEETLVESSSDNDENKQQNNLQIQQKKSFFVRKNQLQDQNQIQKQEKDEGLSEIEKLRRKKEALLQKEREEKRIKEEQEAKIFEQKKLEIEKRRKAMEDKIKAQFTAVSENNDIGDLFGEDDHTTSFVNQESRGNQLMKQFVTNSVLQNSRAENSNNSQESGSQQNKFVRTNIFKSEYSNQSLNNNNNSNENVQKPIIENQLEKKSSENTPRLKKQVSKLKNMFNFSKKQNSDSSLQEKNDEIQNQNQSQKMEEEEEQIEEKKVQQNSEKQKKKSKIQLDSDDDILSATSNFSAQEEEKPKIRRGRQPKIQLLKINKQEENQENQEKEEEIRPLRSTTRSKNTKSKKQENEAILIDSGKQSKKSTNSVHEVSADDFDASQVQNKNQNQKSINNNLSNLKQNNNNKQQQQKKQISFLSKFGGAKGALKPSTGGLQRATNNFDVEDEILKISFNDFSPTESDLRRLKYYGAQVVDDKYQHFDLLVIDESKRTIKLLIALLNNVPIVSQQWIQACLKQKKLVNDYENYIPNTTQDFKEKFDIDFEEIFLERQSIKDLEIFAGYKFFVSPKMDESDIQIEELNYLIELGGGEIVKKQPNKTSAKNKKLICIIGKNEQQLYHTLAKAKLQISDFEIILNSALYSNFDIQENLIDDDFFK